jgi:type IV pilus assembly protein PilA
MKSIQKGFTLIELMIVVAIIAILAAIAIPAYQDFIVRSRVTDMNTTAGACKTSIAEFYASRGAFPAARASGAAGGNDGCSVTNSENAQAPTILAGGIITVAAAPGSALATRIGGTVLGFTPRCGNGYVACPDPATPGVDISKWDCTAAVGGTTILNKYLPAACR